MRPEDSRPTNPLVIPSRQTVGGLSSTKRQASNDAAAEVVRNQIDNIYRQDPNLTTTAQSTPPNQPLSPPQTQPATQPIGSAKDTNGMQPGPGAVNMQVANQQANVPNPYERTPQQHRQIQANEWKQYHSAWQNYYQQYYERYYVGQVHAAKKSLEATVQIQNNKSKDDSISTDEAMHDLRSRLRRQINERAKKVRKSRHFVPVLAAVMVMLIFLFLQYNRVLFSNVSAYITPGSMDPATLIVDPNASSTVSSDPRLIIPKINVDAPIVWDANAASKESLDAAMDKGVAWFNIQGASARPGEKGNFVLSGHSSNDWLDRGDYKFIFAPLERMKAGDTIYVNYNSTRYVYTITRTKVVKPTDVAALQTGTDKPHMTLVTCTPLGTDRDRLLVFADQVSPDPNGATTAKQDTNTSANATKMPANSPTFLQRLFGAR